MWYPMMASRVCDFRHLALSPAPSSDLYLKNPFSTRARYLDGLRMAGLED